MFAAVCLAGLGCGGDTTDSDPDPPAGGTHAATAKPNKTPAEWPQAADPVLALGRQVWLENCENCHALGKAESPKFLDHAAWAPRLAKGEDALIRSAIDGFEGLSEAGMPPRGGNDELTDEEVTAATKYMIHFSRPSSLN